MLIYRNTRSISYSKLFYFKICCICLGPEEPYFTQNCAYKDIRKLHNCELNYTQHILENFKIV